MCGITGYISKNPSANDVRAFKALLLANEDRGGQSAGIYTSGNDTILKKAINPFDFIKTIDDKTLMDSKLVLGHTRLATTGIVKDVNAHPFRFGNITGVHNGIVTNYAQVYKNARVDSEAIFYLLNKTGNNAKKAFKKLAGSFAIAWTDGTGSLYLARDGNPIAVARIDDTIFFSSESKPLTAILYAIYGVVPIVQELTELTAVTITPDLDVKNQTIAFKEVSYGNYGSYGMYGTPQYEQDTPYEYGMICDKCGFLVGDNGLVNEYEGLIFCDKCVHTLSKKDKKQLVPMTDYV